MTYCMACKRKLLEPITVRMLSSGYTLGPGIVPDFRRKDYRLGIVVCIGFSAAFWASLGALLI